MVLEDKSGDLPESAQPNLKMVKLVFSKEANAGTQLQQKVAELQLQKQQVPPACARPDAFTCREVTCREVTCRKLPAVEYLLIHVDTCRSWQLLHAMVFRAT